MCFQNPLRLATLKHPFYEMFCIEIANTDLVLPFWNEVDKRLSKPNDNKEIIATTLLMYLLTNMQKMSAVPDLFAGNYLQLLFHRLKLIYTNHKHELNIKNINLFAILAEKVSDESVKTKTKLKTIKSLLLYPGDLSFEKITGTKTIQKITSSLDCDGVKKLAALYKEIILAQLPKNNANFPNWTIYERVYAAQLFSKLLNFNCVADEQEWKIEQIKFLMNLGIFLSKDGVVVTKDENNIGPAVALSIKDCFYSVLSHKQKNLDDLRQLLRAIIDHSNSIIVKGEDNIPLRTQFSEDDSNCWFQMSDFIKKLKSIDSKETNVKVKKIISVFEILSIHMGFQLFKEPEMARSSLQELQTCFERFRSLGSQKQKKRKSLTEGDEVTDEPEWMEVVVDLILSILSHDSHLLRSVISCVFPHLCPYVNCTVMHQILSVLDPKNEDNPLTKSDSSDSESSDDDEDAEEKNGEEADDKNEESSDNDSDNEEMSEDQDCENDTETDKLRMAISQALGHASDQESVDLDDIDEEEGKRLDKALGEAFKMIKRPKNSKKQSKPDKSLTNFRTRVLDLILIYLNNEPSMYICLEIMLPLFQVLEFAITDPHQNPLQVKVQSCIKNLCNIKKFSTMEGVTEELLYDLMSSLLNNDASSSINVARNKENTECCTFIVRCSILINPDNSENIKNITPLVELYKNQLTAFFTRRDNHLPITFFSNVLGIVWHGNWSLLPICLEQAFNPEIRPFRRALGLKLLQVFYQNYRSLNTTARYPLKVFKKLETNLSTNISVLAESDEASDHEHFFQQLIVLLTLIKKYHKMEKSQIPDHMDWDLVQKNVLKLRRSIKFSLATKSSFNKYCAMLNLNPKQIAAQLNGDDNEAVPSKKQKLQNNDEENPVEENGVHDESNADDESKSPNEKDKKQKPKGISNEKQKLKKQAKLLRLQAQEGLESVSFSQVKMDTAENDNEDYIENNSEEEDTNEAKPKKKHRKRKHSVTE